MKIKEGIDFNTLLDYGFWKIDEKEMLEEEEWTLSCYNWGFTIGHSRRGQFYYLLIKEENRQIILYASEPDGDGGTILCPTVLRDLVINGIVE